MKNYLTIQSQPISFSVTIMGYKVPHIQDQTYTQSTAPMIIQIGAFELFPQNVNTGPNSVDAYVYEGNEIPDQLDLECDCLLKVDDLDWISFERETNTLTIETSDSANIGSYKILIVQSFENYIGVNLFTVFSLQIAP